MRAWEGVSRILTFDLDLYIQGHSAMTIKLLKNIWHLALSAWQHIQIWMDSFRVWYKWSPAWERVSHVATFQFDQYLQGHSTMTLQRKCWNMAYLVSSSLQHLQFWMIFSYLAQMITSMRGYVMHITYIFKVIQHDFAIQLLKYGKSCPVLSTACTVLGGLFSFLVQMITSPRGCVEKSKVKVSCVIPVFFADGVGGILVNQRSTISSWAEPDDRSDTVFVSHWSPCNPWGCSWIHADW